MMPSPRVTSDSLALQFDNIEQNKLRLRERLDSARLSPISLDEKDFSLGYRFDHYLASASEFLEVFSNNMFGIQMTNTKLSTIPVESEGSILQDLRNVLLSETVGKIAEVGIVEGLNTTKAVAGLANPVIALTAKIIPGVDLVTNAIGWLGGIIARRAITAYCSAPADAMQAGYQSKIDEATRYLYQADQKKMEALGLTLYQIIRYIEITPDINFNEINAALAQWTRGISSLSNTDDDPTFRDKILAIFDMRKSIEHYELQKAFYDEAIHIIDAVKFAPRFGAGWLHSIGNVVASIRVLGSVILLIPRLLNRICELFTGTSITYRLSQSKREALEILKKNMLQVKSCISAEQLRVASFKTNDQDLVFTKTLYEAAKPNLFSSAPKLLVGCQHAWMNEYMMHYQGDAKNQGSDFALRKNITDLVMGSQQQLTYLAAHLDDIPQLLTRTAQYLASPENQDPVDRFQMKSKVCLQLLTLESILSTTPDSASLIIAREKICALYSKLGGDAGDLNNVRHLGEKATQLKIAKSLNYLAQFLGTHGHTALVGSSSVWMSAQVYLASAGVEYKISDKMAQSSVQVTSENIKGLLKNTLDLLSLLRDKGQYQLYELYRLMVIKQVCEIAWSAANGDVAVEIENFLVPLGITATDGRLKDALAFSQYSEFSFNYFLIQLIGLVSDSLNLSLLPEEPPVLTPPVSPQLRPRTIAGELSTDTETMPPSSPHIRMLRLLSVAVETVVGAVYATTNSASSEVAAVVGASTGEVTAPSTAALDARASDEAPVRKLATFRALSPLKIPGINDSPEVAADEGEEEHSDHTPLRRFETFHSLAGGATATTDEEVGGDIPRPQPLTRTFHLPHSTTFRAPTSADIPLSREHLYGDPISRGTVYGPLT